MVYFQFGSAVHVGAAIWEYERIRSHAYKIFNRYQQWRTYVRIVIIINNSNSGRNIG